MQNSQTLDEFIAEEIAEDPSFAEKLRAAEEEVKFALELARLREARGFMQESLAQVLGMKQPMLARIERGQIPTVPTLARLAQALGAEFTIRPCGELSIRRCKGWRPPDTGPAAETPKRAAQRKIRATNDKSDQDHETKQRVLARVG